MRQKILIWIGCGVTMGGLAFSQTLDLSSLDAIASRAQEKTVVTIPRESLGMMMGYLSEEQKAGVENLKAVYVRVYEFEAEGSYQLSELDPVRAQLAAQGWTKAIEVESSEDRELVEMYLFSREEKVEGFALIAAEPTELTVINIVGPVDLKGLAGMTGLPGLAEKIKAAEKSNPAAQ